MMKNLAPVALWCICMLFANIIRAQITTEIKAKASPYFSVSAGILQSLPSADPTVYEGFMYQFFVLPGTMTEMSIRYNATYKVTHRFMHQIGGFAESNLYFPISQQWSLRTGVGLQLEQFSYENDSEILDIGAPVDTTPVANIDNSNNIIKFEYEPGFNFNPLQDIKYKLLHLRVPLLLEYHTPINISVGAGVFIQSLLWSESSHYDINSRVETEKLPDGKTLSTYYLSTVIRKKTPAPGLANATMGWQLGVSYRLNQFALEAFYGQTLLNTFANNDEDVPYFYQTYNAKVDSRYIRLGIHYFL